jgi:hypothetical protein
MVDHNQLLRQALVSLKVQSRMYRCRLGVDVVKDNKACNWNSLMHVVERILVRVIEVAIYAENCDGLIGVLRRHSVLEDTLVEMDVWAKEPKQLKTTADIWLRDSTILPFSIWPIALNVSKGVKEMKLTWHALLTGHGGGKYHCTSAADPQLDDRSFDPVTVHLLDACAEVVEAKDPYHGVAKRKPVLANSPQLLVIRGQTVQRAALPVYIVPARSVKAHHDCGDKPNEGRLVCLKQALIVLVRRRDHLWLAANGETLVWYHHDLTTVVLKLLCNMWVGLNDTALISSTQLLLGSTQLLLGRQQLLFPIFLVCICIDRIFLSFLRLPHPSVYGLRFPTEFCKLCIGLLWCLLTKTESEDCRPTLFNKIFEACYLHAEVKFYRVLHYSEFYKFRA